MRASIIVLFFILSSCGRYQGSSTVDSNSGLGEDIVPAPEDDRQPAEQGPVEPLPEMVDDRVRFAIDPGLFQLAHDNAVRWDGCDDDQVVRGGYNSDTVCGRSFFQPLFADHLENYFYTCIEDAAAVAGMPRPEKVFIRHVGTYNDRPARGGSRLSMHAYARGLDITNFNLFDKNGNLIQISTHIRDYSDLTAIFYDEFRDCWAESIPDTCQVGDTESSGSIGHTSSRLGGNSLHADHIHLSFPLCAG